MTLPLPKLPNTYTVRQFRILGLWERWRDGQIVVCLKGSALPLTEIRPLKENWGALVATTGEPYVKVRGNQTLYVSRAKD